MSSHSIKSEVLKLLHQVPLLGAEELITHPAQEIDIRNFESEFRIRAPHELREWLLICDGAPVKPAGIFGLKEIRKHYEWYPDWIEKGWIPTASDGCGDYYVLSTRERIKSASHPIYFLDQSDCLNPAYIVASDLWVFFRFLFRDEMLAKDFVIKPEHYADELLYDSDELKGEHYWPFEKDKVLEEDPDLADYAGDVPFPWDVD
jgi:hypothetical protein